MLALAADRAGAVADHPPPATVGHGNLDAVGPLRAAAHLGPKLAAVAADLEAADRAVQGVVPAALEGRSVEGGAHLLLVER
jgi:hypothetical protein